jgi:8-amino-7-oxononanoate synthase
VIPALVGVADLVVMDELCHSCLLAGASLSRSRVVEFRHNDLAHADALLTELRRRHRHCLLLTDGVFSMEGDLAPLAALAALARRHGAWLMTDDAHGLGVVGDGRGSSFATGTRVDVPLQMGTLSKAVGGYGGYLCASRSVVDLVRNRARSFVYSTGLPPGTVAAASRALDIIATDRELVRRPVALARSFTAELGLPPAESAIVSVVLGSAERALRASDELKVAGFLVAAIRPPTVPPGTSRLRFTFSAAHSEQEVRALATAVVSVLASR